MKYFLIITFLACCSWPVFAQKSYFNQPNAKTDTLFPFNIPMLTIDSTKTLNSKTLMAISKKEKDRKPTVLAFWLTTCIPCLRELTTYSASYPEWKKQANFNFYAISTDFPQNFHKIAGIVRDGKYPFEVYWDQFRIFRTVLPGELNGLPQIFIFDKNGQLAYRHKGFAPGDELTLFARIKELQ